MHNNNTSGIIELTGLLYIKEETAAGEMERQYMTLEEYLEDRIEEGIEESREEGRKEGIMEKELQLIRKKLEKGMTVENIADLLEEDVQFILESVKMIKESPGVSDSELARNILLKTLKS